MCATCAAQTWRFDWSSESIICVNSFLPSTEKHFRKPLRWIQVPRTHLSLTSCSSTISARPSSIPKTNLTSSRAKRIGREDPINVQSVSDNHLPMLHYIRRPSHARAHRKDDVPMLGIFCTVHQPPTTPTLARKPVIKSSNFPRPIIVLNTVHANIRTTYSSNLTSSPSSRCATAANRSIST